MKIGIVGVGNIGSIIASRLVESGLLKPSEVILSNRSNEKLRIFVEKGYRVARTAEISDECDVLFLCVKPQDSERMFLELGRVDNKILISTMTAVSIDRIQKKTGARKIVRIMPNVPAMIGKGLIGACRSEDLNSEAWQMCLKILSCLGTVVEIKEEQMEAVTALSGSAPAFFFVIVEALIDAGIRMGLSYEKSRLMVLETMAGSAELLLKLENHPGEFRHVVTSPAGTTIEGIYTMEREGIRGALMKTIQETYLRALQLKEQINGQIEG
ncbi:pyrroline-5-carboxylate reductase [Pseudothermotoga sp.]|uniref:pyrroline-5-carboxylate reductase n=1 Tax=Pseudothermotoga sp. TaxID=2033661 RepID=UPI0031F6B133